MGGLATKAFLSSFSLPFSGATLFIDEAYNLGKGQFGQEACDTLVAGMTSEEFKDVLIVIAGYPHDLDEMFKSNPGLKSRFNHFFEFPDWRAEDCVAFFRHNAAKEGFASLDDDIAKLITDGFEMLAKFDGFANGRDVKAVWEDAKSHRADRVFDHPEEGTKTLQLGDVHPAMQSIIRSRHPKLSPLTRRDHLMANPTRSTMQLKPGSFVPPPTKPPGLRNSTKLKENVTEESVVSNKVQETDKEHDNFDDESCSSGGNEGPGGRGDACQDRQVGRDDGVPDDVWNDLVLAKQREKEQELELERIRLELEEKARLEEEARRAHEAELRRIQEEMERQKEEERRRLEEERRRLEDEERRRREAAELARIQQEKELQRLEEEKRRREKIKERLRQISKCPMGFDWIRHGAGWRCGGGSHFVSDAELHDKFGHIL